MKKTKLKLQRKSRPVKKVDRKLWEKFDRLLMERNNKNQIIAQNNRARMLRKKGL